jgi:hypothetical protein
VADAALESERRLAVDDQTLALSRPAAKASAMDRADYNVAVGYLRAFARFLVFALHASMAYYKDRLPLSRADLQFSAPVIDHAKFAGSRILIGFNEITLMSLMFFLPCLARVRSECEGRPNSIACDVGLDRPWYRLWRHVLALRR